LDVANMTGNYRQHQLDTEVWQEMRQAIKEENPNAYMMGEYFQDSSPHLQGDGLDASMNYSGFNTPTRRWLGKGDLGVEEDKDFGDTTRFPTESLALQWQQYMTAIPYVIALQQFNQIGSHDISRPLWVTDGDKQLVKVGTALLMGFPGTPCIYYADEIGMDGGHDPDNRRCMPWDDREWDKDMRAFHQQVIAIRKQSHALQHGGFQMLYAEGDLIAFQRQSLQEQMIVVAYRGNDHMPAVTLDMVKANIADGTTLTDLLTNTQYTVADGQLTLANLSHGQSLFMKVSK
jgi:alpha-glucosidase